MLRNAFMGIILGGVLAAGSVFANEPFKLIVTHLEPPLVPNSVMDFADSLGYFEAEGVDVEIVRVQQTPLALAALQAGEGDMANVGLDALLLLHQQGSDLKAVTSPNKSLPFLIAAKDSIATVQDLKDRAFGVGRVGSLDHSLSNLVLSENGFALDQADIVSLGQPDIRAQALGAGQIDATTMSIGVWSALPDKSGLHVLVSQDDYYRAAPVVSKVNVVSTATLNQRPEDVQAVIRALIRLSREFKEDPALWVEAMAKVRPDLDLAILEELSESFSGSWSVNGGMNAQELAYTTDWLFETEDFAGMEKPDLESWVDFAPVDAALQNLGPMEGQDAPDR